MPLFPRRRTTVRNKSPLNINYLTVYPLNIKSTVPVPDLSTPAFLSLYQHSGHTSSSPVQTNRPQSV
ncbi:hypothetical protein, partial [Neisseria mucosa]|uniref:hypothetical protein n=1 Tax=Neisseria mucosa TaxID=488 RepID=UPI001F26721D